MTEGGKTKTKPLLLSSFKQCGITLVYSLNERRTKGKSSPKNLPGLSKAFQLAKKMGEGLGGSSVLQRQMPAIKKIIQDGRPRKTPINTWRSIEQRT